MNQPKGRFSVFLDIFGIQEQRADVLAGLTPPQLITAAIDEFQEIPFLNQSLSSLHLCRVDTGEALDATMPISRQVESGVRLSLQEVSTDLPEETKAPAGNCYLLEQDSTSIKAHKLHWLPAIIGRGDRTREHNDRIAVDFNTHAAGTRVSRRHLQLEHRDGQLEVYLLSNNPVTLQRSGQEPQELKLKMRYPLQHEDILTLTRSRISLRFFMRDDPAQQDASLMDGPADNPADDTMGDPHEALSDDPGGEDA